jgi:hypothetical protein
LATAQEYKERAQQCLQLAHAQTEQSAKTLLIEMAWAWARLAEQAEKNENKGKAPPG